MPKITEFRCLLISPGDVAEERNALTEVASLWNAQIGRALNTRVELVRWESHSSPDLRDPAQEVINRQILDDCHFGIALFWSRLGTPTTNHLSGSDEEIRRLLKAGVRVLVYFNCSPIPQEQLDTDQYSRLRTLRHELESRGLIGHYNNIPHLREQVTLHLTSVVTALLNQEEQGPAVEVLTAPRPDVRVSTAVAFAMYGRQSVPMLCIRVENFSPVPVFLTGIRFELDDGQQLFPQKDSATHESNSRRRLESGDSFDFFLHPDDVREVVDPSSLRRAVIKDAVGRTYHSDEEVFRTKFSLVASRS